MTEDSMEVQQDEGQAQQQQNFKSPFVEKTDPLEFDDGTMLAVDTAHVIEIKKGVDREEYIKTLSRDNAQLLINRLWQLPTERVETIVVATLPARTTLIPREKPVPKARPLTKWQEYRKAKGIQNRKKDKMVWDETAKEFRPRWGYKRANDESAKQWAIELPQGADLNEDPFEKQSNAKKERVAKNELQRLRNIARGEKLTIPHHVQQDSTDHLTKAFHEVTKSTASLGKFVDKVSGEPRDNRPGKKQKFESNFIDHKSEHEKQMRILEEIQSKRPILDTEKAANRQIAAENRDQRNAAKDKKGGKKNKRSWLPPDKFSKVAKRSGFDDDGKKGGKRDKAGKGGKGGKGGKSFEGKPKGPSAGGKGKPGKSFGGKPKGSSAGGKGKPGKSFGGKGKGSSGGGKGKSGKGKAGNKTRKMLKRSS